MWPNAGAALSSERLHKRNKITSHHGGGSSGNQAGAAGAKSGRGVNM